MMHEFVTYPDGTIVVSSDLRKKERKWRRISYRLLRKTHRKWI